MKDIPTVENQLFHNPVQTLCEDLLFHPLSLRDILDPILIDEREMRRREQ